MPKRRETQADSRQAGRQDVWEKNKITDRQGKRRARRCGCVACRQSDRQELKQGKQIIEDS